MFQNFFKVEVLILHFTFFQFYSVVSRDSKVDNFANSLFLLLLTIIRSALLAGIRWSVCMLNSHRSLCVSFSSTGAGLYKYHLLKWSNSNFLHISQWMIIIVIILLLWEFFHTSVRWGFSTRIWETASLFKSPGLFSVFWPISIIRMV